DACAGPGALGVPGRRGHRPHRAGPGRRGGVGSRPARRRGTRPRPCRGPRTGQSPPRLRRAARRRRRRGRVRRPAQHRAPAVDAGRAGGRQARAVREAARAGRRRGRRDDGRGRGPASRGGQLVPLAPPRAARPGPARRSRTGAPRRRGVHVRRRAGRQLPAGPRPGRRSPLRRRLLRRVRLPVGGRPGAAAGRRGPQPARSDRRRPRHPGDPAVGVGRRGRGARRHRRGRAAVAGRHRRARRAGAARGQRLHRLAHGRDRAVGLGRALHRAPARPGCRPVPAHGGGDVLRRARGTGVGAADRGVPVDRGRAGRRLRQRRAERRAGGRGAVALAV
ncbi:MAG: hypothetical protein AVDCRST_MAG16-512, partial [uncultured Frankineae bacterium]